MKERLRGENILNKFHNFEKWEQLSKQLNERRNRSDDGRVSLTIQPLHKEADYIHQWRQAL